MALRSNDVTAGELWDAGSRLPQHMVDLLRWRAALHPDRPAYIFLADGEHDEHRLTFADVDRLARRLAVELRERDLAGQRALLVYDPGLEYIIAFYGCLYAGVVAVPVYPPDPVRLNRVLPRLLSIVAQADARVLLSTRSILEWSVTFFGQAPQLEHIIATDAVDNVGAEERWLQPTIGPDSLAFLQYTSGSSGDPKGAMLSHGNLMSNLDQMGRMHHPGASAVLWLPPYHDMGLIGGILLLAYRGCPMVIMSPLSFVQRPLRWLEAISRFRATSSGSPNFGYELCVKKIDLDECADLDLSSWRLACNGSEPIRADTLERFYRKFEPYGLRRETFCPCYGLAEATLMVSCAELNEPPVVRTYDALALEDHRVLAVGAEHAQAHQLVSSGRPVDFEQVLIVDPQTRQVCAGNQVGEIWVSGPNVAHGYWNRPAESRETFAAQLAEGDEGTFLRTGDLGFLDGEELFVTGRLKDLIIVAGRNHYPQDIEQTVENIHPALKHDGGAAFALDANGEERVVIVQEVVRPRKLDLDALVAQVRDRVAEVHEVPVHAVVLIQSGSLPKTSSGKVQRHAARRMFLDGDLLVAAQWRADSAGATLAEPAAFEPPQTPTERQLAPIWAEVLGGGDPSRRDNFFLHGGQSLLATQLLARVTAAWRIDLPLATLFEAPTLAGFASRIDERCRATNPAEQSPGGLVPVARNQPLPLSFAQQRLWFLDQLEPGNPTYNLPAAVRLRGPLDVRLLQQALAAALARHESLRTVFPVEHGRPRQVIGPAVAPVFTLVDARSLTAPAGKIPPRLAELLTVESRRPFDLARGPLVTTTLYRLAEDDHVLLVTLHHIVADGWSLGVLVHEVGRLYEALERGSTAELTELGVQYADFSVWQRGWLADDRLERLLDEAQARLAGAPRTLELPTDRPRPVDPLFDGALESRTLAPELFARIERESQAEGVTLYMFLLAAFDVLLQRYTGQADVIVGTPTAGRSRREFEPLVGLFVNTLVVRSDLSGDPTFRLLLARVRKAALAAFASQDVPFEKLVERLEPAGSRGRMPLVQVALVLENAPLEFKNVGAVSIEPVTVDTRTAKYELTIYVWPRGGTIELVAEYATELFDRSTVRRLLAGFETLLASAAESPSRRISTLPVACDAERRLLDLWGRCRCSYPAQRTVVELVAEQAARTPAAVAVVDAQGRLSYAQLEARSNQLARYLRKAGIGRDSLVGLCLERTCELPVALLAVLKAGGAYVPLDPAYPSARLAHMLGDSAARVLVTSRRLVDQLPPHTAEEILLDEESEAIGRESPAALPTLPSPDYLAYVIYTSGSTGKPKGVEITHRSLVNFLWSFRDEPGLTSHDVLVAVTTLSFDIAALEMFLPLVVGARVVVARRETAVDAQSLATLLDSSGATVMQATPATWRMLVEADWRPRQAFKALCGGEALPRALAAELVGRFDSLWNLYGPTETTIWSSLLRVPTAEALGSSTFVSIGRPIANTELLVLDHQQRRVPIGVPGELYIGGAGLARGYRNLPELTAERFVAHPFEADERLYRTGDQARWLNDGTLEFLGRGDGQVKIRGYRVELGEIESALVRHPAVLEAAVVLRGVEARDQRLVGYFTLREGRQATDAELRRMAKQQLPDYMVPATFVRLDVMPRTPNGKLDRQALPEVVVVTSSASDFAPPATGTEQALAAMWREVLELGEVGRHDQFFELGGHSLLATQLISRIRALWNIELPLATIFDQPVLSELATAIDHARAGNTLPACNSPLEMADRQGPLALSFAQQRLWFIDQLEPGNPFYNFPTAARLQGPLDQQALRAALDEVVRRHEGLRTVFVERDGQPVQSIGPAHEVPLAEVDLRALEPARRASELERLLKSESRRPFELGRGALLRATLFALDDQEHVLLLAMHHIIADGWSLGVLVRELGTIYDALRRNERSPLADLPAQCAEYALWQQKFLATPALGDQLEWWQSELADLPPALELPTDFARPRHRRFDGAVVSRPLAAELRDALHAASRRENVTFFMTLVAGFEALLARYAGQTRFCLGTPIANRTRVEFEPLIGFCANTLVLRADLEGNPTFRELLARVKQTTLGAYAHQDVPFEKLVEALAPERSRQRSPLFQVAIVLENAPLPLAQPGGLRIEPLVVDNGTSKYDLTLFCFEHHGQLALSAEYSTELFTPATIARLLESLELLLTAAAADPARTIGDLPLVPLTTQRQMLFDFNPAATNYPATTLDALVAEQARIQPQAAAIVGEGQTLSYAELERRATNLALCLQTAGAKRGTRVALCIDRRPELLVGLLAILKTGAAYVPLDPTWPAARLERLLRDADVWLCVSHTAVVDRLPTAGLPTVLVDAASCADDESNATRLAQGPSPDDLAYVIYTSGSSGESKGVEVTHGALVNHAMHLAERYALVAGQRLLQLISTSFDASAEEIFPTWAAGATLVCYPSDAELSGPSIAEFCQRERIDVWHLPTSLWRQAVEALAARGQTLDFPPQVTLVGGESIVPSTLEAWQRISRGQGRFLHAYGLTEAAVTSTLWEARLDRPLAVSGDTLPIGRPIANTQAYVLDEFGRPAPLGVAGELYLGGAGLARGYHRRDELTRSRFIEMPPELLAQGVAPARLYRTGDRARWLADGSLEFFGRIDEQIKLHGLRIEPAEIEGRLSEDPHVREAAVVLREDEGEQQLVAYIVPRVETEQPAANDAETRTSDLEDEQVTHWHRIFDETYDRTATGADPTLNLIGWNSSYTGRPIDAEEMREWLDRTIASIQAIRPQGFGRVLEIGCGTGAVLFRLARQAREYWATDFSAASIRYIERTLAVLANPPAAEMKLLARPADDFADLHERSFDLVVLNSVAQYFPSAEYLVRVVSGAMRLLRPGGAIYLGDLRSYPLLGAFDASIELAQAADDLPRAELLERVRRRMEQEQELCIDPALFTTLGEVLSDVAHVRVRLKRGRYRNELSCFRYEAVIEAGCACGGDATRQPAETIYHGDATLDGLRSYLESEQPARLKATALVNRRVAADVLAWTLICDPAGPATAGALRAVLEPMSQAGLEPEELHELGGALGYDVEIGWSATGPDAMDVEFVERAASKTAASTALETFTSAPALCMCAGDRRASSARHAPWHRYTTDPLRGQLAKQLVPALRARLKAALPEGWLPTTYILLDALPLTVGGKLDRRALPAPPPARPDWSGPYAAPRTELETQLCRIWEELLGVRPVGIGDDFFDLGGHSMLAVKLMAEIENRCGRRLPLGVLFQRPTVAHLAELVARPDVGEAASSLVPIQPRGARPPLFCVHPAGGTVFCYRELASALGDDQPLYGLQAQGVDGLLAPHARIEEMAAHYLRALRSVQPAGPYRLAGWSLGGNIAYEMACQLSEASEEVALVALFDAGAIPPERERNEEDFLTMLLGLFPAEDRLSLERLRELSPEEQLAYFVDRARQADLVAMPGASAAGAQHVFDVFQANLQAVVDHVPRQYTGRVTLLKAAVQSGDLCDDPLLGWGTHAAGGVELHVIPGDHVHMLAPPSVRSVAECLALALRKSVVPTLVD